MLYEVITKKNLFSVMERKLNNNSLGTVFYPISMFVLSILAIIDSKFIAPFGIGLFCMAIGDGLAPFFGENKNNFKFSNKKTLQGSFVVFISSVIIIILFSIIYNLPLNYFDRITSYNVCYTKLLRLKELQKLLKLII